MKFKFFQCAALAAWALHSTLAAAGPSCPIPSTGGPYLGDHNVPVQLDASGSVDIQGWELSYSWDTNDDGVFGDLIGAHPTVTYSLPGTYAIALLVANRPPASANVPDCYVSAHTVVEIRNHAPVANAGGSLFHTYLGYQNSRVMFDGTSSYEPDGDPLHYSWDLDGDGVFGDSSNAVSVATFEGPGEYVVGLRVYDDYGGTSVGYAFATIVGIIPEPSTWALLLPGLLAMAGSARSRRRHRQRLSAAATKVPCGNSGGP